MAPKNGNGNGVKTRDLIIKLLIWLLPMGAAAGGAAAMLGNHEIRITINEKKLDSYAIEQRKQTALLQRLVDKK